MDQKMEFILQYIASADMEDLDRIIEAVIRKCDATAPGTETVLLSLPKEKRERQEGYLKGICNFLWGSDTSTQG